MAKKSLTEKQRNDLLKTLQARFERNMKRHKGLDWAKVAERLEGNAAALWSLNEMERTGGEPDVIGLDKKTGEYVFCDCAAESPKERRGGCYDQKGLEKRIDEGLEPNGAVLTMAAEMGIEVLNEEEYLHLQTLGEFDTKTQSWLKTPEDFAKLGGALYAERRFKRVFVGHNTPPCFYRGRGFRGLLRV